MAKADTYIDFIINELKAGEVERAKVLAKFGNKWQVGQRTFDRHWKTANETYQALQESAKREFADKHTQDVENDLKTALNRKKEKQDILQKIMRGELEVEKVFIINGTPTPVQCKPDAQDIMKAIDIDNKMEGDYAPAKVANTNPDGSAADNPLDVLLKNGGKIVIGKE